MKIKMKIVKKIIRIQKELIGGIMQFKRNQFLKKSMNHFTIRIEFIFMKMIQKNIKKQERDYKIEKVLLELEQERKTTQVLLRSNSNKKYQKINNYS